MLKSNVNYNLESSPVGLGLRKIDQVIKIADFTDGGGTSGTLTLTPKLPIGAAVLFTKVTVKEAFVGDTSAALKLGKTSGEDEFTDGTSVSLFATGVVGDSAEDPLEFLAAETTVYAQLTSGSDFGAITAGKALVEIFYLSTEVELTNPYADKLNF